MLDGGSGGCVCPRHGCCVQARDKICNSARRGVLEGGFGGGFPPYARLLCSSTRPTDVSKLETGTVTKQTTGALQFMVAFSLRGGGGVATPPRIYLTSLCPGRREVRPRTSTPLTYTIISSLQGGTVIGALGPSELKKKIKTG